jgi:glycosyltransferase involved in cell wall biosynthesis
MSMIDEKRNMNIAIVTSSRPRGTRSSWSGAISYMAQMLQKYCGNVSYVVTLDAYLERLIGSTLRNASNCLLKKKFVAEESFLVAKGYARVAARKLAEQSFDLVVAPAGASEVAFLQTDIPIVIVADSTFALLLDYYPEFSNVLKRSAHEMLSIQQQAFKKATRILFASTWAARSAIEDFGVDPSKVHVVPFGASLESPTREFVLQRKKSEQCRLLFLGMDWRRKGGDIAFETLLHLEEMGMQAELVVCGCTPPTGFSHKRMTVIPYLDKNDERQRKELVELFMNADFLLVPSRRECYGMVFCESCEFGLPVIATNTGGISEIVKDGENGFLLPPGSSGADYAEVIANIYHDDKRYIQLVKGCRAAFDARLNWDAWGVTFKNILAELPAFESI